jgi:phosphohistidine phosphatase
MRELHLLRHLKSSWKDDELDDHDRPLSKRGRAGGTAMAGYFATAKIAPDLVLCSSALRTRQTLDLVLHAIDPPRVMLERSLYEAGRSQLLQRLRQVEGEVGSVLLIGHNPGLQDLALWLADPAARDLRQRLDAKFPTGALVSYRIEQGWSDLRAHSAAVIAYVTPRGLDAAAAED